MTKIKIIHEPKNDEPFVVLEKPSGLPSAPLSAGDSENALSYAESLFPKIKEVNGKKEIEKGLLHRIDTATSGLLLIATSQDFFDHIQAAQKEGRFIKGYFSKCVFYEKNARLLGGFPFAPDFFSSGGFSGADFFEREVSSFFRPYGRGHREVRPVVETSNMAAKKKLGEKRLYSTKILSAKKQGDFFEVCSQIKNGFRHQVRCHLAWCGLPINGDALYNFFDRQKNDGKKKMDFTASYLEFPDLYTQKIFTFNISPTIFFKHR